MPAHDERVRRNYPDGWWKDEQTGVSASLEFVKVPDFVEAEVKAPKCVVLRVRSHLVTYAHATPRQTCKRCDGVHSDGSVCSEILDAHAGELIDPGYGMGV